MSIARHCVIHNLFTIKNQPKINKPDCLLELDVDYNLDATGVLLKELDGYDVGSNGLFTIICNKDVFANSVCYRVHTNIWNHKPFLIYGKAGIYKSFVRQGYKTFDLIDYGFDEIEAPHKRLQAFMLEVDKLSRYRNYKEFQKYFIDTVIYNFKHMMYRVDNEPIDSDMPVPKLNTLQKFRNLL